MFRWWLFNPYEHGKWSATRWPLPFSIRVHRIMRPDDDRDPHDHPWNARTFILRGWYREARPVKFSGVTYQDKFIRRRGDTAMLNFGEFHRITEVSDGGCYTLFISGPFRGMWGFLVQGVKVPFKQYLAERGED